MVGEVQGLVEKQGYDKAHGCQPGDRNPAHRDELDRLTRYSSENNVHPSHKWGRLGSGRRPIYVTEVIGGSPGSLN